MLGKLIKYDLRSCLRKFWMVWAGIAVLSAVNGFTIGHVLAGGKFSGLLAFLLGVLPIILLGTLFIAMAVLMLVFICERFYKGLLGDEGYLMFTLPATTAEHIASKAIVALILELISALVAILSGALLLTVLGGKEFFETVGEGLRFLRGFDLPRGIGWLIAEFVLLAVVGTATSNLQIYQAIALGHLAKKHRAAMAVVAFVGINVALSILSFLGIDRLGSAAKWLTDMTLTIDETGIHGALGGAAAGVGMMLLWQIVLGVIFFFGTKLILDRKLNLE